MIQYNRTYMIITYCSGFAAALIFMNVYPLVTGQPFGTSLAAIFLSLLVMIATTLVVSRFLTNKAQREADALVDMYNVHCDPEAFVKNGADLAAKIQSPHTAQGAWFLAVYALALYDCGRVQDAAQIGKSLQQDAMTEKNAINRSSILMNIEPLVYKVFGIEAALSVLQEVQNTIPTNDPGARAKLDYVGAERTVLEAMRDNDYQKMIDLYEPVVSNEATLMRGRVTAAARLAQVYRSLGRTDDERRVLQFVIDHGNGLPSVAEARSRLASLGTTNPVISQA